LSTEDLFSNNTKQETAPALFEGEDPQAPVIDPTRDWLEEYVGEGKKFKDAADLARGKAHSDVFIARLQKEMDGLRQELNTRLKLEEFMDRMNSKESTVGNGQITQTTATATSDGTANNPALSPDDIEKVVEQKLRAKEQELRTQQNLQMTKEKLVEAYGENYAAELENRVNALGLSKDLVNQLAKSEPKALFAMLGLTGQQQTRQQELLPSSPRSSVNTASMGLAAPAEKTYKDYEKIRKQNPGEYWSAKVQSEMHRQALKLGERFYS
jgi:hypothetical protein